MGRLVRIIVSNLLPGLRRYSYMGWVLLDAVLPLGVIFVDYT